MNCVVYVFTTKPLTSPPPSSLRWNGLARWLYKPRTGQQRVVWGIVKSEGRRVSYCVTRDIQVIVTIIIIKAAL